jgi:hypothetical protein
LRRRRYEQSVRAAPSGASPSVFSSMLTSPPALALSATARLGSGGRLSPRTGRPSSTRSWCTTSAPRRARRTSSSTPSAPRAKASRKASGVFSRAACEAPRCANTSGRPTRPNVVRARATGAAIPGSGAARAAPDPMRCEPDPCHAEPDPMSPLRRKAGADEPRSVCVAHATVETWRDP